MRLSLVSCDCAGFASYQRCKHHSALLVALGWVAGAPEPVEPIAALPVPVVTCDTCDGRGSVHGTISTGPNSWTYADITCPDCHGRGEFRCSACMDSGVIEAWGEFCGQTQTVCSCEVGQRLTVCDLTIAERETGAPAYRDAA